MQKSTSTFCVFALVLETSKAMFTF
jgi:hypothetical protein